jgi:hypothetical protein
MINHTYYIILLCTYIISLMGCNKPDFYTNKNGITMTRLCSCDIIKYLHFTYKSGSKEIKRRHTNVKKIDGK